jgi:hypothetical protein
MTTLTALSKDLLTNDQTAELLGIQPNTLEIWRCKGKGPEFIKLGHTHSSPIRYQRSKILEWLQRQTFSSTSAYAPNAKPHNWRSKIKKPNTGGARSRSVSHGASPA